MYKTKLSLKPTKNPAIASVFDGDRYIGKLDKQTDATFIVKTSELIRKCWGFGILPVIAHCNKIKQIIFIYQDKKYRISRERFVEVGKTLQLGEIEKICVPISYFTCDGNDSEPTLFSELEEIL